MRNTTYSSDTGPSKGRSTAGATRARSDSSSSATSPGSSGARSTACAKARNSSQLHRAGVCSSSCSEHTPKSNSRAENPASRGTPSTVSARGPSTTETGGLEIWSACASVRAGRVRAGALGASSAAARSRSMAYAMSNSRYTTAAPSSDSSAGRATDGVVIWRASSVRCGWEEVRRSRTCRTRSRASLPGNRPGSHAPWRP